MNDLARTRERRESRNRWLLLTPALVILIFAASGPLLITLVYSFLTAGDYGGVKWDFSTDAWGVRTKSWTILEIVHVQLRRANARC